MRTQDIIVETVSIYDMHGEALRECLLENPALLENFDSHTKMQSFLDSQKTAQPTKGDDYVYTSVLTTVGVNNIAYFQTPHRLVDIKDDYAYFDIAGRHVRFPETVSAQRDLLQAIYFFASVKDFEQFNLLFKMKFSEHSTSYKILDIKQESR
jgi:hypothetical protein